MLRLNQPECGGNDMADAKDGNKAVVPLTEAQTNAFFSSGGWLPGVFRLGNTLEIKKPDVNLGN